MLVSNTSMFKRHLKPYQNLLTALAIYLLTGNLVFGQDALRNIPNGYSTGSGNYVRTWEVVKPLTDASVLTSATEPKVARMITQYFDGLGRPLQTVVKKGSLVTPDAYNPSPSADIATDLVSPVVYDAYGREARKFLPYVATDTTGSFKLQPFNGQINFYGGTTTIASPIDGQGYTMYYGKTEFEASPLNRPLRVYAPGDSWVQTQATDRGVKYSYLTNTTTDGVRIWTVTDAATIGTFGTYATAGTYAVGQLIKTIIEDEDGKQIVEFKDKEGKVILKKVELAASDNGTTGSSHLDWICTYYIYDDLGQLRAALQPRLVELLRISAANGGAAWSLSHTSVSAAVDELMFRYEYDERGRMIMKKVPGSAAVYMVYDQRERLVLTQDGKLRTENKWLYTQYENTLNRVAATGIFTGGTFDQHRTAAAGSITYPGTTGKEELTRTFYDSYSWVTSDYSSGTFLSTIYSGYAFSGSTTTFPYAVTPSKSTATRGLVTGTKTKVLGTSTYLYSAMYYDDRGRIIQVKSQNIQGGLDIMATQYSFSGQVLATIQRYQNPAHTAADSIVIATRNTLDELGRVLKVVKRVPTSTAWKNFSGMEYDALGQLKLKKLGWQSSEKARTKLAYDYNIRGWITGINKYYLNQSSRTYSFFGMEINYEKNSTLGSIGKKYNGNIGATYWRSQGDFVLRKYQFSYDQANRLMVADFTQKEGSSWIKDNVDFSVTMGNGTDAATAYDMNGNIKRMQQWGLKLGGKAKIDDLAYAYLKNTSGNEISNRLEAMTDGMGTASTGLGDFTDKNTGSPDYGYDANGNMVTDRNKNLKGSTGINITTGAAITYNHLNLPVQIAVKDDAGNAKGTIIYTYDAAGTKLKKETVEFAAASNGGQQITTTTVYLGGAVYENNKLQFIANEEGRMRYTPASGATPEAVNWDYFLKDHLGNVRSVVTEEIKTDAYPAATMETAQRATEKLYYSKIDETSSSKPAGYPSDTYSSPNDMVAKVRGNGNKIGPGIMLKVMSGDMFNVRVSSWWKSGGTAPGTTTNILGALVDAMSASIAPLSSGKARQADLQGSTSFSNQISQFLVNQNSYATARPKAFVNLILLDEQFNYVPLGSDISQVGADNTTSVVIHQWSDIPVTKNGYLYVYVSNETNNLDVFFDNLQVTHTRGPLLEETHYYPFGLTMHGISSRAAGGVENKKGYNGNELQSKEFSDGSGLDVYDFNARTYDPQTGRFIQIDPTPEDGEQESLTPYHFSGNNPSTFNDPDGKCPWCIGAFVGAAVDAGLQLTEIALTDKPLSEFSFTSVAVSAAAGAIGVGIASKIEKVVEVAGIANKAVGTLVKMGSSAATDAATSAASQKIKTGKVDAGEVLIDVVAGATVGKVAGDMAGKAAKNSPAGKVLAKQAGRAERIAVNSTRTARKEAAAKAAEKAQNYAAKRGAAAGTASSGVASDLAKKVKAKDDKPTN